MGLAFHKHQEVRAAVGQHFEWCTPQPLMRSDMVLVITLPGMALPRFSTRPTSAAISSLAPLVSLGVAAALAETSLPQNVA